jgi:hypothetical protein
VPVLVEVYGIVVRGSLRGAFRPETWTLGIGVALYGVSIFLLNPEYLNFIVPMTSLVYGAYAAPMNAVIEEMPLLAFGLASSMYVVTRATRPANRATDVFALAAAGFTAAYLVQSKGWLYQLIPGTAALWLTAASVLLGIIEERAENKGQQRSNIMLYGAVAGLAYLLIGPLATGHYRNPLADDLMPVVRRQASGGSMFAFTTDVWVAFPLVNEAHVGWASRFPTQWLLPGMIAQLTQADTMDPARRTKLQEVEHYAVDAVIEDLRKTPPDIVIVDEGSPFFGRQQFDYLAYFRRDPRFVEFWRPYVKIGETSLQLAGERRFEIWCRRRADHDCAG